MMQPTLIPKKSPLKEREWIPFLVDDERQSYSYVLPYDDDNTWASKKQLDEWFNALHPSNYYEQENDDGIAWSDATYNGELLLRKTAWVVLNNKCKCDYGYSDTWQIQSTSKRLLSTIKDITNYVTKITGHQTINSCNLNYYPKGGGVGFHADDEFLFDSLNIPACIISLSLCRYGGSRKFLVKLKGTDSTNNEIIHDESNQPSLQNNIAQHEYILNHGDIMTMEGMFQKYYLHSIWPGDSKEYLNDPFAQGERINLTWRTIAQHLNGSDHECRGKLCPLSKNNL